MIIGRHTIKKTTTQARQYTHERPGLVSILSCQDIQIPLTGFLSDRVIQKGDANVLYQLLLFNVKHVNN